MCYRNGCMSLRVPQDGVAIRTWPVCGGKDKGMIYLIPPATLLRYLRLKDEDG